MSTAIVLFTRDLRVRDNPVLAAAAAEADRVVPLFVRDSTIERGDFFAPGRRRFLAESLADLDRSLRGLGGRLVVRHGELVAEVCRLAEQVDARRVHVATDVSGYARARERRLAKELQAARRELVGHDEVHTVLAPGRVRPTGNDHFAVFTPYHRRWSDAPLRRTAATPERIRLPELDPGTLPKIPRQPDTAFRGGETEGLRRVEEWLDGGVREYADHHDSLSVDGTSRLSPYLHFGCVSPHDLVRRAGRSAGAEAFVRQLAWRDFHHQVLAARPDAASSDYRPRHDSWRDDDQALRAWQEGQTGIPVVDAGMRQLVAQGWMHNRARLITGSFLTKTLYLDWRAGARHFFEHLLDGDVANNCMNWQWVAGTGTDTRPNRVLSPLRQAERYDPDGAYVRRWVPELADLTDPKQIHQPWRSGKDALRKLGYPAPIVDLDAARDRFRDARQLALDV